MQWSGGEPGSLGLRSLSQYGHRDVTFKNENE